MGPLGLAGVGREGPNYVNRSENAEYIPEWQNEWSVTSQAAAQREAAVPNAKYIYFAP